MIEIKNLTKKYGNVMALNDVSFNVEKGTVFGFVGPNGAGKSTTMSILATLLAPTSGAAYIGGHEVTRHPKKVKRLIGYMPDFFGVYDNLKTYEYLNFYGAAYDISAEKRKEIIPQLLELVNLSHKESQFVDTLSRGMKQRLGLARCLIHDPEVLLLDEPASGLDPRSRIEMKGILKELSNMGKTIIISSHILHELAQLSDIIGVIEDGKMIAIGNVDDIYRKMNNKKEIKIRLTDKWDETINSLKEQPLVSDIERTEELITFKFNGNESEQYLLLKQLVNNNYPIISFSETEGNLEDIFLEITKGVGS